MLAVPAMYRDDFSPSTISINKKNRLENSGKAGNSSEQAVSQLKGFKECLGELKISDLLMSPRKNCRKILFAFLREL